MELITTDCKARYPSSCWTGAESIDKTVSSQYSKSHQISIHLTEDGIEAVKNADSVQIKYDNTREDVWMNASNQERFNITGLGYNLRTVEPILSSLVVTPPTSLAQSDDRVSVNHPLNQWTWSKDNDIQVTVAKRPAKGENNFDQNNSTYISLKYDETRGSYLGEGGFSRKQAMVNTPLVQYL